MHSKMWSFPLSSVFFSLSLVHLKLFFSSSSFCLRSSPCHTPSEFTLTEVLNFVLFFFSHIHFLFLKAVMIWSIRSGNTHNSPHRDTSQFNQLTIPVCLSLVHRYGRQWGRTAKDPPKEITQSAGPSLASPWPPTHKYQILLYYPAIIPFP